MNITIISVGKIKEKFFTDAIKEYTKRLSKYCRISEDIIQDERADDSFSPAEIRQVKIKEGQKILSRLKQGTFIFVLDVKGKQLGSEELANKISSLALQGTPDIAFVIGGSNGLSEDVLNRADFTLSFSKMTFPHQLFKVILLEQIYRAFKINSGEIYHK